jgi:hypothetical protein
MEISLDNFTAINIYIQIAIHIHDEIKLNIAVSWKTPKGQGGDSEGRVHQILMCTKRDRNQIVYPPTTSTRWRSTWDKNGILWNQS